MKTKKTKQHVKFNRKTQKKSKKSVNKPCIEFIDYKYSKAKKLLVCVNSKKQIYIPHRKFQNVLLKELLKTLKQDRVYIAKSQHSEYNKFVKENAKKYVNYFTKYKKTNFRGYTPGELARIIIEDFDDGKTKFHYK